MIKALRIIVFFFILSFSTPFLHSETRMLPSDTTVLKGVLANGMTYYIKRNKQTPGQADFYLANRVGSVLEEPSQRGLAHFLEHMAFNGTKHFPGGNGDENSVRKWCESKGVKFGADLNAYTSIDETVYNISNVPVTNVGVADTCLLILKDWASGLLLKDEEIDAERGVIHEEWRTRRSRFASTRLMEEAMPVIYAGSKYTDCLPIGNMLVIDNFPYSELHDFYDKWYRPDLQAVIVVGDIDPKEMERKISQMFSELETKENAPERIYFPVPDNKEIIIYTRSDEEQPSLNLSLYMKRDSEPRELRGTYEAYKEAYKSKLAMFILRQRIAQLRQEAEPRIISGSVRDNNFYLTPEKDAFAVSIGLLPDNPKAGIDAVIEVIEKARRYGFTESELEHAKIQHAVNIEHKRESKDKARNSELAHDILEEFLGGGVNMNIEDEAILQSQLNSNLTLKEINAVMKDIVRDDNRVCIVFGPVNYDGKPYIMPADSEFAAWIEEAGSRDYENDNDVEEVDVQFIRKLPKKGKILAKEDVGNGYTRYKLSNGVNVSVRPSDLEPNRLTINMFRLGGKSLFGEDDMLNLQLLNSVVKESGVSDFDFLTLEKKRRGKALRVTPYIDDEEEGVKGVCAASDLKTWLEVMYLYVTEPRKDENIFKSLLNRQRSLLKNRAANPNVSYNDSLKVTVYGLSERTTPLTENRLDRINLDRIYEIYNERFSDMRGMELIITGNVREDEFEELICRYVASLPSKKSSEMTPGPGNNILDIRKGNHINYFNKEMKTPSALTNIIYSADITYTAENDLLLDMMAQIMRNIYVEKVREEKGAAYGVSVDGQFWKYPQEGCSLTVNFRCDPEMYETLLPIIDEELVKMAETGPDSKELEEVKEYERKNYDRAVLTNGWWEYVQYNKLRNGIDFNEGYLEKVNSVTVDDIRDFCKKLISQDNRIQVTMSAPLN